MVQPAVEDANTVGLKRSFETLCRDLAGIAAGKLGSLNRKAAKRSMEDSEKASMIHRRLFWFIWGIGRVLWLLIRIGAAHTMR